VSLILDPKTQKPADPGTGELYVQTTALKVKNCGSKYSSDQVVFVCPFCDKRNKKNIRLAVAPPNKDIVPFRCICGRLVYVKHPVMGRKVLVAG